MADPRDTQTQPGQTPLSPPEQDGGSGTRNETRIPRVGAGTDEEE